MAIDRVRANREGISTAQIAMEMRTAIFGTEASKLKRDEDEYPIQVRYAEPYRKNIDALMDMRITFRDMAMGGASGRFRCRRWLKLIILLLMVVSGGKT